MPLLVIGPDEIKSLSRRDICTPTFIAASFTIVKTWEQSVCSVTDEWLKKICMCHGIVLSHKKEGNPDIWDNMVDLEGIMFK